MALGGTGLIDHFITNPEGMKDWEMDDQRAWLTSQVHKYSPFDALNFHGALPSKYVFFLSDDRSRMPLQWRRENAEGVNFFDAYSRHAGIAEAIGKRPELNISSKERLWLKEFRESMGVPKGAFLLGWQFMGSAQVKWYPHFNKVIQKGIMQKYPHVYTLAMGDLEEKLKWDARGHGGRFINPGANLSFREAYLLTGILDCLVSPDTGLFAFSQAFPKVPKVLLPTTISGKEVCCGDETEIVRPSPQCKCSPCYLVIDVCKKGKKTKAALCMDSINPKRVIKAIERVIDGRLQQ